ncbi:MAG: VanW family protein, partial [Ruminococcus sp.]|nr:VanW family protein [Ruminococcus sp.]
EKNSNKLPVVLASHSSVLIRHLEGVDMHLQENKVTNIGLACKKINGIIIRPGETFSFWRTVGKITKKAGYKDGRIISANKLQPGLGGGLCNLGNTIHLLVIHSPLTVTEFHTHSDALAPDGDVRIPMSSGTSVCYNYIDFRFKNTTSQPVQLCVWCENGELKGELRSARPFPHKYEIIEEDHHFAKEGDKYFRISKIYKLTKDKKTGDIIYKKLIRDNHSEVMFDYNEIPKELIRN